MPEQGLGSALSAPLTAARDHKSTVGSRDDARRVIRLASPATFPADAAGGIDAQRLGPQRISFFRRPGEKSQDEATGSGSQVVRGLRCAGAQSRATYDRSRS